MMRVLSGDEYRLMSMSSRVQAPAVSVRVTPFSAPPPMSETFTLATSAVHTSRCSVPRIDTFCGLPAQSMPWYSAPKV